MRTRKKQTETPPKTPHRTPRKTKDGLRLKTNRARLGKGDELDIGRSPRISLKPAFQKQKDFQRLTELDRMYERCNDPSAARMQIAIEQIRDIMKEDWSLLIIWCQTRENADYFQSMITKPNVFACFLRVLDIHSTIIDAAETKDRFDIDTEYFEDRFCKAIEAMHTRAMRRIHYKAHKPDSWTSAEAEQWEKFRDVLSDQKQGKLVVKDWEAEGISEFVDPRRIVIETDDEGEIQVGKLEALRVVLQSFEDEDLEE